jgi:outer membrane protein TolC
MVEVDQARQQELQAQDRYVSAVENYEASLDQFKITLGIPTDEAVALDQTELGKLAERGVEPVAATAEEAIRAAGEMRLDLKTERSSVEDAARRIRVRADALRMQLDVNASASLPSGSGGDQQPLKFNSENMSYGVGFTLDLPLDRKAERNAYVAAIISYQRSRRGLSLLEDSIRLTVRDAYRALGREIVSYRIQKESVTLAEQRVESTRALILAGRREARDFLEAQAALIEARNALTGALVNYTVARLQFYRDIGALRVEDGGDVIELTLQARGVSDE